MSQWLFLVFSIWINCFASWHKLDQDNAKCIHICSNWNNTILGIFWCKISRSTKRPLMGSLFKTENSWVYVQPYGSEMYTHPSVPSTLVAIPSSSVLHLARPKSPSYMERKWHFTILFTINATFKMQNPLSLSLSTYRIQLSLKNK